MFLSQSVLCNFWYGFAIVIVFIYYNKMSFKIFLFFNLFIIFLFS